MALELKIDASGNIDAEATGYFSYTVTPTAYGMAEGGGNMVSWRFQDERGISNFNVGQLLFDTLVDAFKHGKALQIITKAESDWSKVVWAIVKEPVT